MCFVLYVPSAYSHISHSDSINKPEVLKSLEYSNANLQVLRNEVKVNLKKVASGVRIKPVFRKYALKKQDSFFLVMTRTMLDHDTLSSINNLASLWDVKKNAEWIIPNVRGIAVAGKKESIQKKYNVAALNLYKIPGKKERYFIAGFSFDDKERKYLDLTIFIRPVKGRVSSQYGSRKDPFHQKHKFHKGVDIACKTGSRVISSAPGRVVFAGKRGGYGNLIIIEHRNGYRSMYGHLHKIKVRVGQNVRIGQTIALSGSTGRSTGPHLHFEISRRGKPVRPHFKNKG